MLDYKGLRDPHLNAFWQYDGKPYLENNITKAFINVFDSLDNQNKRLVVKNLFNINVPEGNIKYDFYLQKKPTIEIVEKVPEENRIMFGFSPTGKCWGFEGQDIKDEKLLYKAIRKELSNDFKSDEDLDKETEKALSEYLENNRGDSIPDAWIFISVNSASCYLIALENKLYNLDPNQIFNHMEKSLLIKGLKKPIYAKYKDIARCLLNVNTYLSNQFIEYLTILGYLDIDNFLIACSADEKVRQRLAVKFGESLLNKIHEGKKDHRSWNVCRCHANYEWLREINLIFRNDVISMSLAFGSTQNSAKAMLRNIDKIDINSNHISKLVQTFHSLYQRGRNINESYIFKETSLNEYVKYWKNNIDLIKTYTPSGAIDLYKKMLDDGVISIDGFKKIEKKLIGKKNLVLIVPEIILEYSWSYEEIYLMKEEWFVNSLKEKLSEALKAFMLK